MESFEFYNAYSVKDGSPSNVFYTPMVMWNPHELRGEFDNGETSYNGWEIANRNKGGGNCYEAYEGMSDEDVLAVARDNGWDVVCLNEVIDFFADPADYPHLDFETDGYPPVGWVIMGGRLADINK